MRALLPSVVLSLALTPFALAQPAPPWPPRTVEAQKEYQAWQARTEAAIDQFKQTWRSGQLEDAQAMLPLLEAAGVKGRQISFEVTELLRRDLAPLAKAVIEHFPDVEPMDYQRLFQAWGQFGGNPDELDAWLAKLSEGSDFWLKARIQRLSGGYSEQLDELLASMKQAVHDQPTELAPAHRLAVAAKAAGPAYPRNAADARRMVLAAKTPQASGYDWIGDVFKSPNASDYITLDDDYRGLMSAATAVSMLEKALELTPTDADRAWVEEQRRRSSVLRHPTPAWESELRHSIRYALLDAYKRAGKAQEAQALMEALMAENGGHVPVGLQYAGQIQAASGARVVQKKVLDAEATEGDTPEYWRGRGDYFAGRKEWKQAEEAFLKCIEVAAPEGAGGTTKSWAISFYLNLLQRTDMPRAYEEFWKRSGDLPPDRTLWLLDGFMHWDKNPIRGYDERCWKLLAANERWDLYGNAERLLMEMIEGPSDMEGNFGELHTAKGAKDKALAPQGVKRPDSRSEWRKRILLRAAELSKDADGTRSAAVISAMQRTRPHNRPPDDPLDALPMLEYAVKRNAADAQGDSQQRHHYESMVRMLSSEYLNAGQWRKAMELKPAPDAYSLAYSAAKAGDLADAMGFWKQCSAADRMNLGPLHTLRKTALRDDLIRFYEDMAKAMPENAAPPKALAILKQP